MSKAFHTWNETISAMGSPLMGPPSNDELFARLNRMKSFRRFRALCEAIGLKPPDGASEAKVVAWWRRLLEMPEDFHDKLWQLFADHIEGRRQLWAKFQQVLSVTAMLSTKTDSWIEHWSRRTNDLIAQQALKIHKLEDRAESLARRVRPRRRRFSNRKSRALTPKQLEASQIVAECKGNIADAARRLGRDRKTVEQHYRAACKKMGIKAVTRKPKTQSIPVDHRGQPMIAKTDSR